MPRVVISTTSASEELIAAPSSGSIRVLGVILTAVAATDVSLVDGDGGVILPLTIGSSGGGGAVVEPRDDWQMDLPPGKALDITNSASVKLRGILTYRLIGTTPNNPPRS